jgi:hypothetical protein
MSAASKPVRPFGDFLRVLIAPAIWFAHFSVLYAAEALICIGPPGDRGTTMGWTVFLATAAALTSLAILAAGILRAGNTPPTANQESTWFPRVSVLLTILSVLGVIWTVLPTLALPACALPGALQG